MRNIFCILSLGILFFSCQKNEIPVNNVDTYGSYIDISMTDSTFVNKSLAEHVACSLAKAETRSAEMIVDDIVTLVGKQGLPAMYVINYKNNQGYVIVSASKNYYPVLMKSDSGRFSPTSLPKTFEWYLGAYKSNIDELKSAPYDTVLKYRREWSLYEPKQIAVTRAVSSLPVEIIRFMENSCIKWKDQLCEISPIAANGLELPPEIYRKALYIAELFLRKDYMETSFLIKKNEWKERQAGPMISTRWNQGYPYNAAVRKYFGENYLTGCVATAMAQIMKYNRKPQQYDWEQMPPISTSSDSSLDIANLMLDIGLAVKMNYGLDGSGADNDDTLRGFHLFGYNNAVLVSHDEFKVRDNIYHYHPVFMTENRQTTRKKVGHAWVCDGGEEHQHRRYIT